jgi:sugar lactone lactonase YvrE
MRDGLWLLQGEAMKRRHLADPPYDPDKQRFNDGKADARGRLWVGTIDDARAPDASLYCWTPRGGFERVAHGVATSNGVAFSPDGRHALWADTRGHRVLRLALDAEDALPTGTALWHAFDPKVDGQPLETYGGRPDGAAMDAEGGYWVAMFEGKRLVRLDPQGRELQVLRLPVRCPTMPAFGGADGRTLFITTARENRPPEELAAEPMAGRVLQVRTGVTGLPAHLVHV